MLPQKIHEQRKNALMRATVEVIAAEGMEGLTTRGVGSLCGVKEIYIYRYFENRDDMVAKTFTYADKCLYGKITSALSALKAEKCDLRIIFKVCLDYALSYPDWLKFYVRYYYSSIFPKNSYAEHIERYSDLASLLFPKCESTREAEALLNMLIEAILSLAFKQSLHPHGFESELNRVTEILSVALNKYSSCEVR